MASSSSSSGGESESLGHLFDLTSSLASEAKTLQEVRQSSPEWFLRYEQWGALADPQHLIDLSNQFVRSVETQFRGSLAEEEEGLVLAAGDPRAVLRQLLTTARTIGENTRSYAESFKQLFESLVQDPTSLTSEQVQFTMNSLYFSVHSAIPSFISLLESVPRLTARQQQEAAQSAAAPPPPLPKRAPNTRAMILAEIMSTEETYFNSLRILSQYFVQSWKESLVQREPLTDRATTESFSDAIEMVFVLSKVLLSDLKEEYQQRPKDPQVGSIFRRLLPLFRLYSQYINRFGDLQERLQQLQTLPRFQEWSRQQEFEVQGKEGVNLSLNSCLILPVQRLPRYEMLLQSLLKETSSSHSDFINLSEVVENLRFVNTSINQEKRMRENISKINAMQQEMPTLPPLFKISSVFLRSTQMDCRYHREMFSKSLNLIMFNHILILATIGKAQSFVDSFSFDETELKDLDDPPLSFELINLKTRLKWRFWAKTPEQKESWLEWLDQAIRTNSFRQRYEQMQTTPPLHIQQLVVPEGGQRLLLTTCSELTGAANWIKMWDSRSIDMPSHVNIYRPVPPAGFYIVGDYAETYPKFHALPKEPGNVLLLREDPSRMVPLQPLLAPPVDYTLVWTDSGTGGDFGDLAVWIPVPPEGYVALGAVTTIHYSPTRKPDTEAMRLRCVHKSVLLPSSYHAIPVHASNRRKKMPGPLWSFYSLRKAFKTTAVSFWSISDLKDQPSLCPATFFPSTKKDAPPPLTSTIQPYCFKAFTPLSSTSSSSSSTSTSSSSSSSSSSAAPPLPARS